MLLSLSSVVVIALLEEEVVVVWLRLGVDDTSKTPIRYSHQPGGREGGQGRPVPYLDQSKQVCVLTKTQSRFVR